MNTYIKKLTLCAMSVCALNSCNLEFNSLSDKTLEKTKIPQKFPGGSIVSMYKSGEKDEIYTKYGSLKLKVNPKNSKVTIVHYKQIHDSPILINLVNDYLENKDDENMKIVAEESIKYLEKLNSVHKNIASYHLSLSRRVPLYAEGHSKDSNLKSLKQMRAKKILYYGLFKFSEDENLKENLLELNKNNMFGFGSELYLGVFKKTPILPLEPKAMTLEDLMNKSYNSNKEKHMELREDGMIEKVLTKSNNQFMCRPILLGASHDLKNNVEEYNKRNPDNQLRLIEFNPEGVPISKEELNNILGKKFIDAYDSFIIKKQSKLLLKLLKKD